MRRGPAHTNAAWLCVAVYLVLSVGVSDLVLCVGKEGHVAIESRFAEDCCDDARGAGDSRRLEAADACECVDASLLQPAAGVRTARGAPALPVIVVAALGSFPVVTEPLLTTHPRVVNARHGSPPLRALRTVVLVV
jgi:hypothetical protein